MPGVIYINRYGDAAACGMAIRAATEFRGHRVSLSPPIRTVKPKGVILVNGIWLAVANKPDDTPPGGAAAMVADHRRAA